MPYVHNGRVVEKRPFSLVALFDALVTILILFFTTLVSTRPVREHVEDYRDGRTAGRGGPSEWQRSVRSLFSGATRPPGGGGGADSINRRGRNVHTFSSSALSGGCGSS